MNMVKLYDGGVYLVNGTEIVPEAAAPETYQKDTAKEIQITLLADKVKVKLPDGEIKDISEM